MLNLNIYNLNQIQSKVDFNNYLISLTLDNNNQLKKEFQEFFEKEININFLKYNLDIELFENKKENLLIKFKLPLICENKDWLISFMQNNFIKSLENYLGFNFQKITIFKADIKEKDYLSVDIF